MSKTSPNFISNPTSNVLPAISYKGPLLDSMHFNGVACVEQDEAADGGTDHRESSHVCEKC